MQLSTLLLTTALAAYTSAYEVLSPALNSTVQKGQKVSVKWTSVDADADYFSIYIVNFKAIWPPVVLSLAQNVPRKLGSIDVYVPYSLQTDYGYQINFINGTNTYVIYAQSKAFFLEGEGVDAKPTTSIVPFPTATGYSNKTTVATGLPAQPVCKVIVENVVYGTPIIWFVNPGKEPQCPEAKETVTVTVTAPSCEKPTHPAEGPKPTSSEGSHTPTGTGAPIKPTGQVQFTGAGSAVQVGGLAALIFGAAALLL